MSMCVSNDKSLLGYRLVRLLRRCAVDWGLRCLGAPYDTHTRSSIEQMYKVLISYCVTHCVLHRTHARRNEEQKHAKERSRYYCCWLTAGCQFAREKACLALS
jgi:hypothetical protein